MVLLSYTGKITGKKIYTGCLRERCILDQWNGDNIIFINNNKISRTIL